jgi:hypothetical protein
MAFSTSFNPYRKEPVISLRYEQYHALKKTRDFLYDLFDPEKYPKTKKEMRARASFCLRHFPHLEQSGKPIFSQDTITKD